MHDILTTSEQPIKQGPRQFPLHQRGEGQAHIEEMLRDDIIEPSSSP